MELVADSLGETAEAGGLVAFSLVSAITTVVDDVISGCGVPASSTFGPVPSVETELGVSFSSGTGLGSAFIGGLALEDGISG